MQDADDNSVGHEKSTRMHDQFKFITDLLPQIDGVVIPDITFDVAYGNARPVARDDTHQVAQSIVVDIGLNRPTAVKGLFTTGPENIPVNISTGDEPSEEAKAAERERKDRTAKQNALPSWMSNSTITGEAYANPTSQPSGPLLPNEEVDTKNGITKHSLEAKEHADIDDYFARLKAEQMAEAALKAAEHEDDFESDDEDEDFEDIVGTSI